MCIVTHRLSGSGSGQTEAGSGMINAQSGGVASSSQFNGVHAGVINIAVCDNKPSGKFFQQLIKMNFNDVQSFA